MPRIKKLAPEEISKIAAGEVVERPANVVKELIENALDAGANTVELHIAHGGKTSIQIVDNGCGMDAEDARACFEHHATSKLTSVLDLPEVNTFGFRGEALSSIAAVSEVTLITKQSAALEGIKLTLSASNIINQEPASCNVGTSITVNNLFFNVPARKKFLRTTETEWHQILQLFQSFALNYPAISWSLHHNGTLVHRCPPVTSLTERVLQLWDQGLGGRCMPIMHEINGIKIEGVVSDHQYHRYDRNRMFFFVNKRWVKNQQLGRALVKGYTNVLPQGQYPFACVSITLPPAEVDINVHPRKEEVQFAHPRVVEQTVQMTVQAALQERVTQLVKRPQPVSFSDDVFGPSNAVVSIGSPSPAFIRPSPQNELGNTHSWSANKLPTLPLGILRQAQDERASLTSPDILTLGQPDPILSFETNNVIGQYANTYIMLEHPQGLLLIDQHAAHERILYERFLQRFEGHVSTKLLFPQMVPMATEEIAQLEPYFAILQAEGIEIEQAGANQLVVTALPMAGKQMAIGELLKELVSWVHENQSLDGQALKHKIIHQMRAMMACKAAVKAGDVLSRQQVDQLLDDLQAVPNRLTCPHGRPTSWLLPLSDIERKFKRRL